MVRPYKELTFKNIKIRWFTSNDAFEYKWHFDLTDRTVYCIPFGLFLFQLNDSLPKIIKFLTKLNIERNVYHRVIRKRGYLITLIIEHERNNTSRG